jgi:HrpA-like RNA helicase
LSLSNQLDYHIRKNKSYSASTVIKSATERILLWEAEEDLMCSPFAVQNGDASFFPSKK